jgi:hypothetical protein
VIAILRRSNEGGLLIRAHPDWEELAAAEDRQLIREIIEDLIERVQLNPDSLLQQLAGLGVGQLVTHDVGEDLASRPDLEKLYSRFKPI